MMSFHLKTFWTLFQIITEHYKALVASPQTDHYFAWCSVLFVPTIVICHWEATRRRAKKNQDKIYGAAGRRSVLTMLLRKSDKNIKLWLNICILSWLEIHILSLYLEPPGLLENVKDILCDPLTLKEIEGKKNTRHGPECPLHPPTPPRHP